MRSFYSGIIFLISVILFTNPAKSQTILINPTGDGGFENGADFVANGWTVVNGTAVNKWFVGAVAGPSAGANSAYISNDAAGATHTYTLTSPSVVHIYRDITFPAGETNIQLQFKWKSGGESTFDWLAVWSAPTTTTPLVNVPTAGGSSWNQIPVQYTGATLHGTQPYNLQSAYQTVNICFPASYAGTTRRIVFTWSNDNSIGVQPPVSLDEINLNSSLPPVAPTVLPTGLTFSGITTSQINGSFTAAAVPAQGYIVVQYPAGATPVSPADNTVYTAGSSLGTGTIVSVGTGTTFTSSFLSGGTTYDFYVYPYNGNQCSGPFYGAALSGSQATLGCSALAAGTYSVGPTGTYPTLTAALAAAANGVNGTVIFELQAAYTSAGETFPITITSPACVINNLIIRPAAGATALQITSSNATATIDFNLVRNVTIDGRPGGVGTARELSIINSSSTGVAIRFINDASNNTVTYTDIQGENTSATSSALSGVIYFAGAGPFGQGNDTNTISFNNIHGTAAATPTMGVVAYGSTTTVISYNDGNILNGNNIYDFFSPTAATSGIKVDLGNNAWTISNNSFYQRTSRTYTTANTHRALWITPNTGSINNTASGFVITGNNIGGTATGVGGSAYTMNGTVATIFNGMDLSTGLGTATSVQNNTISNISLISTNTGNVFVGIGTANGNNNIGTVTGNIIGSTTASTITVEGGSASITFGIRIGGGTNNNVSNNTVAGFTVGGTGTVSNNFVGIGTGGGVNTHIVSNTVGSNTVPNSITLTASNSTTSQSATGINLVNGTTSSVVNNTVANITNNYSFTGAGTTRGIVVTTSASSIIGNTVHNLRSFSSTTGTGSSSAVAGIVNTSTNAEGVNVIGNTIHTLVSNSTTSTVRNITGIFYAGSTAILNRIEKNFIHSFQVTTANTSAVMTGIDHSSGTSTISNNMIRLGVHADGSPVTTAMVIRGISSNSTSLVNNIHFNSIYIGGTGAGTGTSNTYAFIRTSTSGTYNIRNNIFVNNRSNATTGGKHFAIYFTTNTNGITANSNVYSYAGTGGVFAYNGTTDVPVYSSGWIVSDVNSFVGDPLFVNPTGTAANVNLHIQTGSIAEGTGVDIPAITEDFDSQLRSTLTPVDIGADAGDYGVAGVDVGVTSLLTPAAGLCYSATQPVSVTLKNFASIPLDLSVTPVTVTVTATGPGGLTYNSNIIINTGTIPAGGTLTVNLPATIDMTASGTYNFQANAVAAGDVIVVNNAMPAQNRTVGTSLGGVYNVGTGQSATGGFETLTAAVAAYNAATCLSGNVVFLLTDATYSTAEAFPITINNLASYQGTNSLTIRPAAGVNATITGANVGGIIVLNGAKNIIIDGSNDGSGSRNLTIINNHSTGSSAAILIKSLGLGAGTTNSTIKNSNIVAGNVTGTYVGINIGGNTSGSTGDDNDNITIENNTIARAYHGVYASAGSALGANNGLVIRNNIIGSNSTYPVFGNAAIYLVQADGALVSGNTISGIRQTGSFDAISLNAGVVNSRFTKNIISGIVNNGTNRVSGIGVLTGTTSNNTIDNNFISDILNNGTGGATFGNYGIYAAGGNNNKIWYNTIYLRGDRDTVAVGKPSNFAAAVYIAAIVTNIDVRNNIFYNALTAATNNQKSYGLYNAGTASVFAAVNYNDFFVEGAQGVLGFQGTDLTTLAQIQANFGAASKNIKPEFVSFNDLHLLPGLNIGLNNSGTPVPGVTDDIDNDVRSATTPDMGADEFEPPMGVDVTATALLTPEQEICYSNAEQVSVRIRNFSANVLNFAITPVTVNVNVTGATTATFTTLVNTGSLAPGDSLTVVMPGTLNMTTIGNYIFNATATTPADVDNSNDTLDQVIRVQVAPDAGTISSNYPEICVSGTPSLSMVNNAGGSIQWQVSSSAAGPWTNVGSDSTGYTPSAPINSTTYYRAYISCNTNSDTSNVVTVLVNNPMLLTTTPATRCGPGTVTLSATASPGAGFFWYTTPTGGAPIANTASYTTPIISTTTTYYVTAANGTAVQSLGAASINTFPNVGTNNSLAAGILFTVTTATTIASVDIYPTVPIGTPFKIVIRTGSATGAVVATYEGLTTVTGTVASPVVQTVPVNFSLTPGSYAMTFFGGAMTPPLSGTAVYPGALRNNPATGVAFPYTIPGVISITNSSAANTWYYFYNWQIGTGCESPRQAVVATVTPAPVFSVSDSNTICNNAIQALSVTSPAGNFDNYIWTPSTYLFTDAAATIPYTGGSASTVYIKTVNAGTYTYTINAVNNTTTCTGIDSVAITVLPGGITVAATPSQICVSGQSALSITPSTGYTGAQFQWQSSPDGTTFTDIAGATSQNYNTPVISTTSHYRVLIKDKAGVTCQQPTTMITVNSPAVLTTTPAALCGPGTMTLGATGSAGTTLNWYADANGGLSLGTGTSFTTPNLTVTDTFYVSATAGGSITSVGPMSVNNFPGKQTSASFTQGMVFDVLGASINIQSVDIFPTTAIGTNFQIVIRQFSGSGAVIATYQGTTTVQGSVANPVAQTVPVNFNLPGGFDYVMTFYNSALQPPLTGSGVYPGALRNNPATGVSFPYAIPNEISITSSTNANTWNYFYNWRVGTGCESPRLPVIAMVSPNTAITAQPVNVSVCAGATVNLSVTAVGANLTYQWMKGATPIANATSSTYSIPNSTVADAGTYSVVITGLCGNVTSNTVTVTVSANNTWTGILSSDWNTAGNWCGSIPTSVSDVVIPSGTPNDPVVNSLATVHNLTISSGATVTVNANGVLNLYGNYSNSGTFTSTGFVVFKGSTNQNIASITSSTIIMNGTGGVTLAGNMTASSNLILENGNISIGANTLTFSGTPNGSVASHIITGSTGSVVANNVTTSTIVPVGPDAASYNPVTISNGQGRNYTVRVAVGLNPAIPQPGVAVNRTWNITPSSAVTSNVQLTFQYADGHMNNPGSPVAMMQVGAHNGTTWSVVSPASGLIPVGSATDRRVTVSTTSFGPMVVTNIGGINIPTSLPGIDQDVTKTVLMPNLVRSQTVLRVKTTRSTRIDWMVVDMQGRVMMTFYRQVPAGTTDIPLDFSRFANGQYLMAGFTSKGKLEVLKFVKM